MLVNIYSRGNIALEIFKVSLHRNKLLKNLYFAISNFCFFHQNISWIKYISYHFQCYIRVLWIFYFCTIQQFEALVTVIWRNRGRCSETRDCESNDEEEAVVNFPATTNCWLLLLQMYSCVKCTKRARSRRTVPLVVSVFTLPSFVL